MKYSLSIVLDDAGLNKIDVITMDDLYELDQYTVSNFLDKLDARNKLTEKSEEYSKALSSRNSRIVVTYTGEKGRVHFFQAFFKDREYKLNKQEVLSEVKRRYEDDNMLLRKIYGKIRKGLKSESGKREFRYYFDHHYYPSARKLLNGFVRKKVMKEDGYPFLRWIDRFTEIYENELEKAAYPVDINKGRARISRDAARFVPMVLCTEEEQLKFESVKRMANDPDEVWALYDLEDVMRYEGVMLQEEENLSPIVSPSIYVDASRSKAPSKKMGL